MSNSPDFEYIACIHDSRYNGKDSVAHIKKFFGYSDLEKFKSDTAIYENLNHDPLSYKIMLKKLENYPKIVRNEYNFDDSEKVRKKISIACSHYNSNAIGKNGSNIGEVFNILRFKN